MDNVRPRGSYSPIKRSYYTKPAFRPKDLKQDVKTFGVQNMTTAGTRAIVNTGKGKMDTDLKKSRWVWRPKGNYLDHVSKDSRSFMLKKGNLKILLQDHTVVDSGCSSHMTGNKAYLSDYEDFNRGFVAFGSDPKGESEQALQDEPEKMVTQELAAKAMDDVSRQAFEEKKRRIASQKKVAQATSTNILSTDRKSVSTDRPSVSTDRPFVSTDRPFVSTDRPFVSTDRPFVSTDRPSVSIASTPTGTNAGESSFVYLGGKIPIDASTLPNADLPIDPNMPDLEDASDTLPNDGIFNGAYDDDEDVGAVADFNNMDNTIAVSPIPTLRIHKDHPKGQILGDPTSAVQTRGKIQKASSAQQALGKKIGNVTPLFSSMLAQPTEDEGVVSERPSETQPTPSPTYPKGSGGNHGAQAANIKDLKAQIKQLKKKAWPVINHHKACIKSLSMKKRLARKKKIEFVSKQGRKNFKSVPTMHKDPAFDDLDDAMDYMETEDAHDEGTVKDSEETRVSTEDQVSTDKPKVSTDKLKVITDKPNEGTDEPKDGNSDESAAPTTVFRDDETIAQFLIARKVQKEWEVEEEKKKLAEEEATKVAFTNEYDFIQARLNAYKILAKKLQEEEREKFTIEQRAKFLHDTIAAQRRFLAQQRICGYHETKLSL
ncbi:hypothetical protein Tco_0052216 [Tanacetum coccineum]